MKIILALTIATVISLVDSNEELGTDADREKRSSTLDRMPLNYGKRIPSRSLRSVLDRMSVGYGKRDSNGGYERALTTVEDLAAMISSQPNLAQRFVRNFIDTNGDGLVSVSELSGEGLM
ncbi:uncharacterized protein LOC124151700 isoform X2 [Haliotis rufescens]|nr:uncharacterized protein LOC124151700 isoform X2 [Haliotis rufescens]XP_046380264.2 uncharacterized protein LOC124151700 isoform X2 [Haliotis rufescens]XP_046380272.2 uncharacterized protein LOC124151700 isoform X2 [Haliotis rufescens]